MKSTPCFACFSISSKSSSGWREEISRFASSSFSPAAYMGTVPRGTLVPASISLRMASRSPAMERSITVSAPAFTAAFSFFISISGLLQSGEVPMLALTLMPAGCPTRMGSTFLWQGLPRSTMVPSEMALRMTLRSSPSLAQRLSRWASRSFLRALFLLRISDILFSKKGRRKAVPSHGSQRSSGCVPASAGLRDR